MGHLLMDLGGEGAWMRDDVIDACLRRVAVGEVTTIELIGAEPERHPRFRELVILARALRRRVAVPARLMDHAALAEFLAEQEVDAQGDLAPLGAIVIVAPDGSTTESAVSPSLASLTSRPVAAPAELAGAP